MTELSIISENLNLKNLYRKVGNECRRCHGSGTEPGEEYFCLLCRGFKVEDHLPSKLVCARHPEQELVPVAKRFMRWDDANRDGFYAIKGCPICNIPMLQTGSLVKEDYERDGK